MSVIRPSVRLARAAAIPGWMSEAELHWLSDHAVGARTIIEIGSFCGRSTRALADHCSGVVYAIDPWAGYCNDDGTQARWILETSAGGWTQIAAAFQRNLADHLASGRVIALRESSETALARLLADPSVALADLVFIDGDHRYDQVRRDIEAARPLLRPGGVLSGHDLHHRDWPGVAQAVAELCPGYQQCDSIWWVTT